MDQAIEILEDMIDGLKNDLSSPLYGDDYYRIHSQINILIDAINRIKTVSLRKC